MLKTTTITQNVCDNCQSTTDVRSYQFACTEFDGHRNEEMSNSIELCKKCQMAAYELLKASMEEGKGQYRRALAKADADKAALVGEVKIMCRNALELGYCNEIFCQNCNTTAALARVKGEA